MKTTQLVTAFFLLLQLPEMAIAKVECCQTPAPKTKFRGGKVYELNPEKKKLLLTFHADLKSGVEGKKVFTSRYLDLDNNELLAEEATFNQLILQSYVIQQKQLNEIYELNITGNKMNFSVTRKGKTQKKTRDLPPNLVIGPSFVPFLQEHWSEIQDMKKVKAELAVLERMNTYGFVFEKLRDSVSGKTATVVVRMRPISSLIAAVVRPVYFTVTADGSRIVELKGRILPKRKVGTRWEDFDAEAVFTN